MGGFLSWLRAERDRAAGVAFLVAGAICLAVGYAGVAGATYVPQALSFIASGGFFGLLLVAVGATLLITAALHDEWRKLDRIEKAIDRLAATATVDLADHDAGNGRTPGAGGSEPAGPAEPLARAGAGSPRPLLATAGGAAAVVPPGSRTAMLAAGAGLVGAAGLVAGGWSATASAVTDTTAYTTVLLGMAGLAVAGVTSAGWTLSLRRSARVRQARLLAAFDATTAATEPERAAGHGRVAVAPGLTLFHSPGCAAVAGVAVRLVEPAAAGKAGLTGCRLCRPGG